MKLTPENRKALEEAVNFEGDWASIEGYRHFKRMRKNAALLLEIWEPLEHTEAAKTAIDDVLIYEDIQDNHLRNRLRTSANALAAIRKAVG